MDRHVVLLWVPSCSGVHGGDRAGRLAKQGCECGQIENEVTCFERGGLSGWRRSANPRDKCHTIGKKGGRSSS